MKGASIALLSGLLALAAYRAVHGRYTLNRDEPMVAPVETKVSSKPSRRVLLVVLDGARRDVVDAVPTLRALAANGATAQLEADLPTISAAQYVSLLTGVTPQTSGRRSNDDLRVMKLDSVPDLVRRGGGSAAVYSDGVDWWWELFPQAFAAHAGSYKFAPALELAAAPHDFLVVHLCAFDEAGHALGASSPAYRQGAALEIEWKLSAVLRAWSGSTVLVTADHGHRDEGGHGGGEPEVRGTFLIASGDGINRGARAEGRAVDVAPTLAALLGLPSPATTEGAPLAALLAEPPPPVNAAAVIEEAERTRTRLEAEQHVSRALRGGSALAVLLLVAALARRQRKSALVGFVAGLVALGLAGAAYAVRYGTPSPSGARTFGVLVVHTLIIGIVAGAVVAPFMLRLREGREHALLAAAAGSSPLVVWMYTAFGVAAPRVSITTSWALALPSLSWACWAGTLLVLVVSGCTLRRGGGLAQGPVPP